MDHRFQKFLAVAETKSFSAAAKQLHVSQPAITLAMASLEHIYGVKLYTRKRHAIELTDEGELFARHARKIAAEADKLIVEIELKKTSRARQMGIIDSVAYLLYGSTNQANPLQGIEVMVDNSRRIISDLLSARIDAGIITGQFKALSKDLTVRKLHDEEFVFVRATSQTPSKLVVKRIDDWLAVNKDSTSFDHFLRQFRRLGIKATPIFYSSSMELLKDMAIAGKGTALLPVHFVQDAVNQGQLHIVRTAVLKRPIWAVSRTDAQPTMLDGVVTRLNRLLYPREAS